MKRSRYSFNVKPQSMSADGEVIIVSIKVLWSTLWTDDSLYIQPAACCIKE